MKRERYKATIEAVDSDGRVYNVQYCVAYIDGRACAPFYRLEDGTPVEDVGNGEFEIGIVAKARARRVGGPTQPQPSSLGDEP
jgi:hypothetical protein